ncbi:MAG TPA: KR domain-containing protein [Bacillota bacterium]|nr:KR domain-containing protein [Bacillota bacterium]
MEGTWLLDKLTDADDLDFFILFSSVVTLTGGAGLFHFPDRRDFGAEFLICAPR